MDGNNKYTDLAPNITRQRLIIEGTLKSPFSGKKMSKYCEGMTEVLKMTAVTAPTCNYDSDYGWCAYMHWKESGIHIYAWDEHEPPFFSVDIYTCRSFEPKSPVEYTREFFGKNLISITWKE